MSPPNVNSENYARMPRNSLTTNGTEKLLVNRNSHKASGPDEKRPIIVKYPGNRDFTYHRDLVSEINGKRTIPRKWKSAHVVPMYKMDDRQNPTDYRRISLTYVFCKTIEHIVSSSIMEHFTILGILYHLEHSFCEKDPV